jgi:hypothetical protein
LAVGWLGFGLRSVHPAEAGGLQSLRRPEPAPFIPCASWGTPIKTGLRVRLFSQTVLCDSLRGMTVHRCEIHIPSISLVMFSSSSPSTSSNRVSYPSCPINQRPQGRPLTQPLTWEELLGQR